MVTAHNPGNLPQRFERETMVNVRIEYAAHTAIVTDSIENAVDDRVSRDRVVDLVSEKHCSPIETLAARIVNVLATDRRLAAC